MGKKDKRILITTNHMSNFAGSEIVALEIAEAFILKGFKADIYANYTGSPMKEEAIKSGVRLLSDEPYPNPFDYDIIWSQHHVLPILLGGNIKNGLKKPYFVYTHLSPYQPFEVVGVFSERLLADRYFLNSLEVKNAFEKFKLDDDKIVIFYNAAPVKFFDIEKQKNEKLNNIAVISNHLPEELLKAIDICKDRYGVEFKIYGSQNQVVRIEPEHLEEVDAVISIGKSVQYAIAASRPVYCYDHFGGPGWLTLENYKLAGDMNYSGRCTNRKISAEEIAAEIISGFATAFSDINVIRDNTLQKYNLDTYVDDLIKAATERDVILKSFGEEELAILESERNIAALIAQESRHIQDLRLIIQHIEALIHQKDGQLQEKAILINEFEHERGKVIETLLALDNKERSLIGHEVTIQKEIANLMKTVSQLESTVAKMRASTSWRLTAPLRKVMALFK
ncbi:hypothetical protein WJT86_09015 [Microvirga sp. W0021]|uniref:Glycosyltransferase n=1 Tax=Hohaiivirga grylli TaxID=3133970 RepID=A0ABV0BLL2_9HYPH